MTFAQGLDPDQEVRAVSSAQSTADDLLWRHLKGVPAFRALLRAVEARFYQDLDLPRPVLDLGCGDGHFAQTALVQAPAVGLDPGWRPLQEAARRELYRLPVQARGDRLPFADGQFGSVISNSVLEHIDEVGPVLQEASRVLRPPTEETPGGLLVITMPSENFGRFLSIAAALRRLGLDRAGDAYEGWFNRISRHHHCDSPQVWHERLAAAGLRTVRWQYYFSKGALRRLEWGHYLGLPALASKLIFGRWIIAPWRSSLQWTERAVRPFYHEPAPERGAYLLFLARRMAPGELAGPLPAARPQDFTVQERVVEDVETAASLERIPEPVISAAETEAAPGLELESSPGPARIRSILWLVLALLFALLGQVSWNWIERPNEPTDGLSWYGLALASLALFIWQSMPGRRVRRPRLRWSLGATLIALKGQSARLMLLLWAFVLSLLARGLMGDAVKPPGSPAVAVLLWLAGIALALAAFWPGAMETLSRIEIRALGLRRWSKAIGVSASRGRVDWGTWDLGEVLLVGLVVLAALALRLVNLDGIPYVLAGDEANMGREAVRVVEGELSNPFITGWFSHPTLFFFILAIPIKLFGPTVVGVRLLTPFVGALTVLGTYLLARRAWGRPVAVVAAVLLTGYHYHIHYSRLALNNAWDPLFALLVLGTLWRGWQTGDRRFYVVAGLGLGISQFFYMGARMLLVLLGVLMVYWLLRDRRRLWAQRANLAALLVLALIIALPIVIFSLQHPDDYMARVNQLGIFQSGWLAREVEITGQSQTSLLWQQFWKAALAFNYTIDPTFWYRPDIPLLRFWPSVFFVFGLALALVRIKRTPDFLLLAWVTATVIFGGMLLENPPSSQRYVIAAPASCLLVALALVWLAERLRQLLGGRREVWWGLAGLMALWFAAGDVDFYFRDYTPNKDFGGENTEVAHRVSEYLNDLGPGWQVYFFGVPRMGIARETGFPTVGYLAPQVSSVDVAEPLVEVTELAGLQPPVVFIYLPERAGEMGLIRSIWPDGVEKRFPGRYERMLFIAYEVRF